MRIKSSIFIVFCGLIIQFILGVNFANAVGTSCVKVSDTITINVNLAFYADTGVDLSEFNSKVSSWTSDLNKVWNQNYQTSDGNLPVEFVFNTLKISTPCPYSGYHCVMIKKVGECGGGGAHFDRLADYTNSTIDGCWEINVGGPRNSPLDDTRCCDDKASWHCDSYYRNSSAHEVGHAMGIWDEYLNGSSSCAEKNVMGWGIDCTNNFADQATQAQIDKIVQEFCRGSNAVCSTTMATDVCEPTDESGVCIRNNKCPYNDASCGDLAGGNLSQSDSGAQQQKSESNIIQKLALQVPIFNYTEAANLPEYIVTLFQYAMLILIPLSILMIILAGISWVAAAGNQQKIKAARDRISSALLGLILGLLTYTLLSFVGITQLQMQGIQKIEPEQDTEPLVMAEELGLSQSTVTAIEGQNPYKSICDQYSGPGYAGYIESVGLKCKALGNNPPAGMTIVPLGSYGAGSGLYASASGYAAFKKSADCVMAKFGKKVTGSGWRSAADQYTTFKSKKPGWAAKPCCSNHGTGAAFDVRIDGGRVSSWTVSDTYLKDCFAQNGLYAKIRGAKVSEPWHFSPSGY